MSDYQLAFNSTTKVATVQAKGDALPAGSAKVGTFFKHNSADDELGETVADTHDDNHVMFHHVRDLLYNIGEYNMQIVSIVYDIDYIAVVSFTVVPPTVTKAPAATQQITHVWTPSNASNKKVLYVSSDVTKATVNATGLVTAVATGSATITCTTEDGGFIGTCVVTIS